MENWGFRSARGTEGRRGWLWLLLSLGEANLFILVSGDITKGESSRGGLA